MGQQRGHAQCGVTGQHAQHRIQLGGQAALAIDVARQLLGRLIPEGVRDHHEHALDLAGVEHRHHLFGKEVLLGRQAVQPPVVQQALRPLHNFGPSRRQLGNEPARVGRLHHVAQAVQQTPAGGLHLGGRKVEAPVQLVEREKFGLVLMSCIRRIHKRQACRMLLLQRQELRAGLQRVVAGRQGECQLTGPSKQSVGPVPVAPACDQRTDAVQHHATLHGHAVFQVAHDQLLDHRKGGAVHQRLGREPVNQCGQVQRARHGLRQVGVRLVQVQVCPPAAGQHRRVGGQCLVAQHEVLQACRAWAAQAADKVRHQQPQQQIVERGLSFGIAEGLRHQGPEGTVQLVGGQFGPHLGIIPDTGLAGRPQAMQQAHGDGQRVGLIAAQQHGHHLAVDDLCVVTRQHQALEPIDPVFGAQEPAARLQMGRQRQRGQAQVFEQDRRGVSAEGLGPKSDVQQPIVLGCGFCCRAEDQPALAGFALDVALDLQRRRLVQPDEFGVDRGTDGGHVRSKLLVRVVPEEGVLALESSRQRFHNPLVDAHRASNSAAGKFGMPICSHNGSKSAGRRRVLKSATRRSAGVLAPSRRSSTGCTTCG